MGVRRYIFGFLFAAVPLVILWLVVIQPLIQTMEAQDWPAVPCIIVQNDMKVEYGSEGDELYSLELRYEYEHNNIKYQGNRYDFIEAAISASSDYESIEAIIEEYPPGSQSMCFLDPLNPQEAVLNPEIRWGKFLIITAFCSVFLVVAALIIKFGK